jgi:hypothetical protein
MKKKNRSRKPKLNLCEYCREKYTNDKGYKEEIDALRGISNETENIKQIEAEHLAEVLEAYGVPFDWKEVPKPNNNYKDYSNRLAYLRRLINKELPHVINNHFLFHSTGPRIFIFNLKTEEEISFIHYATKSIWDEDSHFTRWQKLFELQDKFNVDINLRRNIIRNRNPNEWVMRESSDLPELNLMNGGYIDLPGGTYRKADVIPAMLCNNELVFTQEAVRGMGQGSRRRGGEFGLMLNDYFEKEAKKYAHKR